MVEYTPPPKDLSRLNPIQRYMQKGYLEWSDYAMLVALITAYWLIRPALQRFFKSVAAPEVVEGEQEQDAYQKRRAQAAIDANEIRSGKAPSKADGRKTVGQLLDEGSAGFLPKEDQGVSTSTSTPAGGQVVSRQEGKKKARKGVSFAPEKSEEDRILDWEDESQWDPSKTAEAKPDARTGEVKPAGNVLDWIQTWDK